MCRGVLIDHFRKRITFFSLRGNSKIRVHCCILSNICFWNRRQGNNLQSWTSCLMNIMIIWTRYYSSVFLFFFFFLFQKWPSSPLTWLSLRYVCFHVCMLKYAFNCFTKFPSKNMSLSTAFRTNYIYFYLCCWDRFTLQRKKTSVTARYWTPILLCTSISS